VEDGFHFVEGVAMPKVSLRDLLHAHGGRPADVGEASSCTVHLNLQMARNGHRRLLALLLGCGWRRPTVQQQLNFGVATGATVRERRGASTIRAIGIAIGAPVGQCGGSVGFRCI
jgi:hypothetical protein